MSRIGRFMKPISIFVSAPWRWLWSKFDVGFRRMCVMSSLHAQLTACKEDDIEVLTRLNQRLHLVDGTCIDAMRLPTLFGPRVWKGVQPLKKMDHLNERYFERLVRMTPCWLLYTDTKTFINDLREMIGFCVKEYSIPIQM